MGDRFKPPVQCNDGCPDSSLLIAVRLRVTFRRAALFGIPDKGDGGGRLQRTRRNQRPTHFYGGQADVAGSRHRIASFRGCDVPGRRRFALANGELFKQGQHIDAILPVC